MVNSSKILTVSYGTFSCTAEGFEDPLAVVKDTTHFFRGVVREDPFFGAEPPQFDAELAGEMMRAQVVAEERDGSLLLRPAASSSAMAAALQAGPSRRDAPVGEDSLPADSDIEDAARAAAEAEAAAADAEKDDAAHPSAEDAGQGAEVDAPAPHSSAPDTRSEPVQETMADRLARIRNVVAGGAAATAVASVAAAAQDAPSEDDAPETAQDESAPEADIDTAVVEAAFEERADVVAEDAPVQTDDDAPILDADPVDGEDDVTAEGDEQPDVDLDADILEDTSAAEPDWDDMQAASVQSGALDDYVEDLEAPDAGSIAAADTPEGAPAVDTFDSSVLTAMLSRASDSDDASAITATSGEDITADADVAQDSAWDNLVTHAEPADAPDMDTMLAGFVAETDDAADNGISAIDNAQDALDAVVGDISDVQDDEAPIVAEDLDLSAEAEDEVIADASELATDAEDALELESASAGDDSFASSEDVAPFEESDALSVEAALDDDMSAEPADAVMDAPLFEETPQGEDAADTTDTVSEADVAVQDALAAIVSDDTDAASDAALDDGLEASDDEESLDDALSAILSDETEVTDETASDVETLAEQAFEAMDEGPVFAEDTAEEPEPQPTERPAVRARVVKVKRAVFEEAVAAGQLEEVDEDEPDTAGPLSADKEDELARELAAVKAEMESGLDDWDDTEAGFETDITDAWDDDAAEEETPLRLDNPIEDDEDWGAWEDAPAAQAEPGGDDAPDEAADPLRDSIGSAVASVRKAVKMSSPGRAMLTERQVEDDDASRILSQTETELEEPEGNRRRSAIAHLRAAVAATRADRLLGRKPDAADEAEPYREDLATVVRPRRPQPTGAARPDRPVEQERPAPLKLVAEQRVEEAPEAPAAQVRPRRVAVPESAVPQTTGDEGSFADYAETVGARELPELLEAAAAYMSFVEGRDQFSRPQLMTTVRQAEHMEFSREDRLRSFGQLLREGKIEKTTGGRFTASDRINFKPGRRAVG